MSTNVVSLGWRGTGRMGTAMADRLIDAGESITVWNRTRARTQDFLSLYEQQARNAAL